MLSFTSSQIKAILMKPIQMKACINEVITLQAGATPVISTSACMDIVIELFDDIRTGDAVTLFSELGTLEAELHEWSSYLYRTTDELNAEIGLAGSNVSQVNALRSELTNVFNLMNTGYAAAAKVTQHKDQLSNDFFGVSPYYQLNYVTAYPASTFDLIYNESVIDTIVSELESAKNTLATQKSELTRLRATYATTIEPITPVNSASWLPTNVWIRAEDNNVNPRLTIYTDANLITGLGSNFQTDSLLVRQGGTYTINYDDTLAVNTALKIIDSGANTVSIIAGTTATYTGDKFRTMIVRQTSGTPADLTAQHTTGMNSFVVVP